MSHGHFAPGSLVVCVDDRPTPMCVLRPGEELVRGRVYTIRDFLPTWTHPVSGAAAHVRLEEIVRPLSPWSGIDDMPYLASRFRPLDSDRRALFNAALVIPATLALILYEPTPAAPWPTSCFIRPNAGHVILTPSGPQWEWSQIWLPCAETELVFAWRSI
jgi:hypothetical protein